jgi:Domain of unknown function (DUF4375)
MTYPEDFDELVVSSKAAFTLLDPQIRVVYCLHQLEAEVNNGGFHQFFSNSSGEYVRETIKALTDIGAAKTCDLLKRAVAICFPEGYPADAKNYESVVADLDDVEDDLEQLDQEFFRYAEPLADLVNEYLARGT